MKRDSIDWLIEPIRGFINKSTTSGLVLFGSAALAILIANSPWAEWYHEIWQHQFSIGYDEYSISKNLHHWINDGLMAVFFFVVGLELKREILAGELSRPRDAIMPVAAAIGGMLVPALIYVAFNNSGEASNGWGIPMATDIAFALGVLYLLGKKVPISIKIFLTVLAVADDLGAVVVIALFYTSNIDMLSLGVGVIFLFVLILANLLGVRNTVFYAVVGIGGVWLAFLMSGVHATIAAVLAAFTIPANVKISEVAFSKNISMLLERFKAAKVTDKPTVSVEQFEIVAQMRHLSKSAVTPLQRLEHFFHPIVSFLVLPVFAFSNSGVGLGSDFFDDLFSPVGQGVFYGLLIGKVVGVCGTIFLFKKLKLGQLPQDVNNLHVIGLGFLAAIGFTMSLFITELAFDGAEFIGRAKIAILSASILASLVGYTLMRFAHRKSVHTGGQ